MRYFFTARLWKALGVLLAVAALLIGALSLVNRRAQSQSAQSHIVDVVAAIAASEFGEGWQVADGKSVGDASLTLDDGRVLRLVDGTRGESTCNVPISSYSCVLLADTLGAGVLWFALVPSDATNGRERLTLPALVDMQEGGDLGVLSNGWVIPLATPTIRNCDTETTSLRDFINQFPEGNAISLLDLYADTINEVVCTGP
jgi:hypothetical protein